MKKFKFISTIILALGFTISCSEEQLELTNPNELSPDTFFKTEAQVQSAVNAAYANLQTRGLYSRHLFFMMDNMSQENGGNEQLEADKRQYIDFSFDSSHGAIGLYWDSCFRGINKANFVIGNTEAINEIPTAFLNPQKKAKFIGEAKFLRAYYYFLLVTRFGDLPLITVIPEDGTGFPRSPKTEVYNQIISDLTDASAVLFDKGVEDSGRATKGAALAMLGKVHLYLGNFDEALAAFNALSGYALEDNYFDNFMEETEHGVESIFEIEYDLSLGFTSVWGIDGSGPNEATFRSQEYGFNNWFNVFPSDDLLEEYEMGDPRLKDNFYVNGDTFGPEGSAMVDHFPSNGGGNAGWKKYQNYYKLESEQSNASGINFKIIRYADVLLMMAEAESMRAGGNQDVAIGYINQVRARPSTNMPPLNMGMSQAMVFDAIVHERKVELAGEQVRFNDIVRWGNASTELVGTNFQAGKHEIFPIPDSEIDSNENIGPENQNPGY